MKHLWLFNPENDIALAHDTANFTAPVAAVSLRKAGEILPLWVAYDGDVVLCSGVSDSWLKRVQQDFGIKVEPWAHDLDCLLQPWGWSKATRRFFEQNGFVDSVLPSDKTLSDIRRLSHRRTSAVVAEKLKQELNFPTWDAAVEIDNVENLKKMLADGRRYVLKSPWSSSGRGIVFVDESNVQNALRQAEGTIKKQGSIMVERSAERVVDFAMLFDYSSDECSFCGYSLFSTDTRGVYTGNIVSSQTEIVNKLSKYIDIKQLEEVESVLPVVLREVLGCDYRGPIGVDMLATTNGMLHPVVEVNLRWTMGFVALRLARFVEGEAFYSVIPGDCSQECVPIVDNGKLISGTLALNPPGGDFTFILKKD